MDRAPERILLEGSGRPCLVGSGGRSLPLFSGMSVTVNSWTGLDFSLVTLYGLATATWPLLEAIRHGNLGPLSPGRL